MRLQAYLNNFFWLFFTCFFAPLFYCLIFVRIFKRGSGPAKILVIQPAKIGDLVCTTPVFREIKKNYPACFLTALVISQTKDILKNNPHLDEILALDDFPGIIGKIKLIHKLRKERYDWVFSVLPDALNNLFAFLSLVPNRVVTTYNGAGEIVGFTSAFNNHRLEYKKHALVLRHYLNLLKFIGVNEYSEEKEIFIKPAEEQNALNFLKLHNVTADDLIIGLSCAAGVKFSEWEGEKFARVADDLAEKKNAKIIFIGSSADYFQTEEVRKKMRRGSINSCGKFTLLELPALIKNFKLFIGVDTGPLYIADALGIPVIDIMGPSDQKEQSPSGKYAKIIQKDCPPCLFIFAGGSSCREENLRCLKDTTVEEVLKAAYNILV